jgi:hypothetical protein
MLKDKRDLADFRLKDNDIGVEGRWKEDAVDGNGAGRRGKVLFVQAQAVVVA